MTRALYWIHRWTGVVLALLMLLWFASGLVIAYSENLNEGHMEQLAHAQPLHSESAWLSLGEAWERSAAARKAEAQAQKATESPKPAAKAEAPKGQAAAPVSPEAIVDARLVRIDGQPRWLVENGPGKRYSVSAIDGSLHGSDPQEAERIAREWASAGPEGEDSASVRYLDTIEPDTSLRNQASWKPFHRVAVEDGKGSELLISARTGEVIRESTGLERALYYSGNYIHLFKFLELVGLGEARRDVTLWLGFGAAAACFTGLIIGWLRWRPGWNGKPTYSQGRTQPYRESWSKWHFWSGLLGGSFALTWALSGYFSTNPLQIFSEANPTRPELTAFYGKDLPTPMGERSPGPVSVGDSEVVELAWRRLGEEAVLVAFTADGQRFGVPLPGVATQFSEGAVLDAARRLAGGQIKAVHETQTGYDAYYFANHRRGVAERPLPVSRVDLEDPGATRLYVDPIEGRILIKQDQSRRVYRWVFNFLHYWDFGWFNLRPLWDGWMLTWIGFGLVLSASSLVLAWRRLKLTFKVKKPARKPARVAPRPIIEPVIECLPEIE